jgi:hypothetical protein
MASPEVNRTSLLAYSYKEGFTRMEHRLVRNIEKALSWPGPQELGVTFARGQLPEPDICERLLTPTRFLDLVMRRSLTTYGLRCLVGGVDLNPREYLSLSPARRGQSAPMADMRRIGSLLQSGCSLILDMAHLFDPTLEVACRALQWWAHEFAQVNLYLTTGEAAGFNLHWDDHDVLIVQLAGEKSWEVRGTSRPVPMYRDATPNPTPPENIVWAGTMHAGQVMHIPRGYWHRATRENRGDGYSLHATFGFTQRTGVHWLEWLADQARASEVFRYDLDRFGIGDQRRCGQLELTDEAVRLVATRSVQEFVDRREPDQPTARHVATHGLFGPPSTVVCVTEFPPVVDVHDELVTVRAAAREITLQARALPAVRRLLSGEPAVVADVTATTGVDAAELADMFVAEGLCAEVTEGLAAGYAGWLS